RGGGGVGVVERASGAGCMGRDPHVAVGGIGGGAAETVLKRAAPATAAAAVVAASVETPVADRDVGDGGALVAVEDAARCADCQNRIARIAEIHHRSRADVAKPAGFAAARAVADGVDGITGRAEKDLGGPGGRIEGSAASIPDGIDAVSRIPSVTGRGAVGALELAAGKTAVSIDADVAAPRPGESAAHRGVEVAPGRVARGVDAVVPGGEVGLPGAGG